MSHRTWSAGPLDRRDGAVQPASRRRRSLLAGMLAAALATTQLLVPVPVSGGSQIGFRLDGSGDAAFGSRLDGTAAASTTPPPAIDRPVRTVPPRDPHPRALANELATLVAADRQARIGALSRAARLPVEDRAPRPAVDRAPPTTDPRLLTRRSAAGPQVAVTLTLASAADGGAVTEGLARIGGAVLGRAGTIIEADVPIAALEALAATPGIRRIEPIRRPRLHAQTSPGIALLGASAWQDAAYRGDGIRIGIIDGGFAGFAGRLGTELPATVQARCYSDIGAFSASLGPCEQSGETHGTAVAETIVDMAPGAALYIANPISYLDYRQTITWMTSAGVRIVNASFGASEIFEGPGDGTSPYPNSFYSMIDAAVSGGALWVNSAGNSGDLGWTGPWADANGNGWLEFSGADEANSIPLAAGESIDVAIRWADPWGTSANDYDLYLFPAGGTTAVAQSIDDQAGAGNPVEHLSFTAPTAGVYEIAIAKLAGSAASRIQLLVGGASNSLTYRVSEGTLPSPADSANPGMVTVGAVNVASPETIEPYSSRGPTTDGRTKPDLVAVDCAATTTIALFCGTSEAAPYVTGAAALLLQADPTLGPAQLAAALRSRTIPLGGSVPNSTFGWGRLALGPAPTAVPPPQPASTPGPAPLGAMALSTPGVALTAWRGLATSGTTGVHVVFGERSADGDAVVYRRSLDGGATFDAGILLSTVGVQAGYPAIASAGSAIHVAWLEGDVGGVGPVVLWYRSSADGGATWGAPRQLSAADGRAGNPGIATDGANVLVAWTDAATGRLYTTVSADGGAAFGAPQSIGSTTLSPFTRLADLDALPAVAFGAGGRGYVAWSSSPTRLLVRRTPDGGRSWLAAQKIDATADGYSRPWLAAYGSGVAVAYGARPVSDQPAVVFVRRSSDGGETWASRRLASAAPATSSFDPAVTIKGKVLRLAYAQCTSSACTRARLWYRQSADGGVSWSRASALTGTSTYAYPVGVAATSRILVLYDAATSSSAETGTLYLRIR